MSSKNPVVQDAVEPEELPQRLCSEIQLFDLCDLDRCSFKEDRFCNNPEMLARFEAIAEPEDRQVSLSDDEDEEDEQYPEEFEEDDDEYSVFDDEDRLEQDDAW